MQPHDEVLVLGNSEAWASDAVIAHRVTQSPCRSPVARNTKARMAVDLSQRPIAERRESPGDQVSLREAATSTGSDVSRFNDARYAVTVRRQWPVVIRGR
jgi:hypothetical protein